MKFIISAAALAVTLSATSALAQIRDLPPRLPEEAIGCLGGGGVNSLRVQTRGAQRTATAPLNTACPRGAVLSAFSMAFQGGDHKLNTIGILREGGNVRFDMADRNGDDSFTPSATFLVNGNIRSVELTAVGSGETTIAIPAGPAGTVPVLQGFKFFRSEGTDANVRLIGVQIIDDSQVRVALVDDQGADFRSLEGVIGKAFEFSFIPFAAMFYSPTLPPAEAIAILARDEFGEGGMRSYGITVQIAFVPGDMVMGRATFGGTRGGGRRPRIEGERPAEDASIALQGFRFFFENSDHHLRDLKVMPNNSGTPAKIGDSDGEDPFAWAVDYVVLQ
ncbi:MAG TPA: hypothetical protein PL096_02025 [Micropepsaceae bacterium]|nr:hypothetical protein [Micropepsaceae bacterium]